MKLLKPSAAEAWEHPQFLPPELVPIPVERAEPRADWALLSAVRPDAATAEASRIVSWGRTDPAHRAFDLLRTRLLAVLAARGWSRVGITSARRGAGRSMVAANLALSLGRRRGCRTVLLDLDLGAPGLADCLGLGAHDWSMARYLTGAVPSELFLSRIGDSLAVGLNSERVHDAALLLHDPRTAARLDALADEFSPTAVLCDMPPLLETDDALGFLGALDAVLIVAPAGEVSADDLAECERLLEDGPAFLGVVLNRAPDEDVADLPEALEEPDSH